MLVSDFVQVVRFVLSFLEDLYNNMFIAIILTFTYQMFDSFINFHIRRTLGAIHCTSNFLYPFTYKKAKQHHTRSLFIEVIFTT